MPEQIGAFRTAEGRARYMTAYEENLARWPVPFTSGDAPTRFGVTHYHACGPADAPPLVLLPGQGITSTMWYPNVAALSRTHRVFAPDILGDLGKSVMTHPDLKTLDFGAWLAEFFDGLGLARAHVAGLSYGGFLALKLALAFPERVDRLVLMEPAGLLPLPVGYFFRMAAAFLPLPFSLKQRLVMGTTSPLAAPLLAQMMVRTDFRYQMFLPPLFTDAELAAVAPPVLLLFGARGIVYNPEKGLARARAHIPRLETAVIPGAGHALTIEKPEAASAHILAFLAG